ncbi:uncharacterized protein LOC116258640 isoform X2 [Nymphaea colorata]|uniref:uncharacterized protein LOC116258640 isoform X2 n=1 Tax=Nymphaea colorata TaxID=210225 RepID=UPI00129E0A8B|nr:uncharacterized protein LOC116258640 isoform X2 [Nymphaea colorata]
MAIPFSLAASVLLLILSLSPSSSSSSSMLAQGATSRRQLRTFKELRGNTTFECFPSGPCVACHYSEKDFLQSDEKYHCSETGYRIPFKCADVEHSLEVNGQKYQKGRLALQGTSALYSSNHWNAYSAFQQRKDFASPERLLGRRLLKGSSSKEEKKKKQHYMIFKSCTPTVDGEKLTILGFEGIILCLLLVSCPIIYIRKKHTSLASGLGMLRIPTNSRY